MFAKKDFNTLLDHYKWNHTIKLVSGTKPKIFKIYFLSLAEQSKLDMFIIENLYTDQIRSSKFPIAIPVSFIKKKYSFLQLVQNYRTFRTSIYFLWLLWQPLITKINSSTTNKFLRRQISHGDYKRTQPGVSNIFLHYLYNTYMVHAND